MRGAASDLVVLAALGGLGTPFDGSHCPVCGGQLAKSDETTCPYCSSTLGGGKHEWALLAVSERPEDKPAPARKARRQEHDQSSPSDE